MYNQNQNGSGKWIFFAIIFVAILALFLGVQISQAKWLSKPIAQSEAKKIENETNIQTQKAQLNLELYEKQIEADIQEIERQKTYQVAQDELELEVKKRRAQILDSVIIGASVLAGVAVMAAIIGFAIRPSRAGPQRLKTTTSLPDKQYQQKVIAIARKNEELSRHNEILLRRLRELSLARTQKKQGGEKQKYGNLPLAS